MHSYSWSFSLPLLYLTYRRWHRHKSHGLLTLIHMWATRKGKIILICALSGIVLLLLGFRILISKDPDEGHKNGMATAK